MGFQLRGFHAQVDVGGSTVPASLENGQLNINFAQRHFTTNFDLVAPGLRLNRRAEGVVGADGSFGNSSQFLGSNMVVQGVVAQPAGLPNAQAGYVFQTRVDEQRSASGVTHWLGR